MTHSLEILYVGRRHRDEVATLQGRGVAFRDAETVYDGIAHLKRHWVGAVVVEYGHVGPNAGAALDALRAAARDRPLLVVMTTSQWDGLRASGLIRHEEVLLCPFYPDEVLERLQRAALPPPSKTVRSFRNDSDRLAALMEDVRQLNRFVNDLGALCNRCASIVKARLQAARVSIFIKERSGDELKAWEAERLDKETRESARVRLGEGVAGEIADGRRVTLVRQAGRDGPRAERDYEGTSYIIAPVVYQGAVLGVICITDRVPPGPFSRTDLEYVEAFVEEASTTVHNALQYRAADELATIDELTQLFNRRHFNRALPQEMVRAQRYEHDLTLAIIDIDHFKQFNDVNGHQAGDHALATVARILKDSFRQGDIVVRHGGEEFAIIMPATRREDGNGVTVIDRARRQVEEAGLMFVDRQGHRRRLTVSGGVATYPLHAESAEDLFQKADQALYAAKARGKNLIVGAGALESSQSA